MEILFRKDSLNWAAKNRKIFHLLHPATAPKANRKEQTAKAGKRSRTKYVELIVNNKNNDAVYNTQGLIRNLNSLVE
jgi:hypothetical protein